MPDQPSKPSKPTFEGFEGLHPNSSPKIQPPIGTFARPRVVRATRALTDCPYNTCGGELAAHGRNLYECRDCKTWFELKPLEDWGAFLSELAEDFEQSDASEWVM